MKDYLQRMLTEQGWKWDESESSFFKGIGQYSREYPPSEYLAQIQVDRWGKITICDDALGLLLGEIEELKTLKKVENE